VRESGPVQTADWSLADYASRKNPTMFDLPDALVLARIQFAFTVSFHFLFPAITIGLASYLAVLEALWLKTGREHYMDLFRYWIKIFALVFGMGVVSGIVMSYQFGTNWAVFSDKAGPIIGPLMAYEVLTAFFLEAGFLGVMLFGMNRVGKGLHFTATLMVALGTFVSAFWILSVNSWMHTPAGYTMNADGQEGSPRMIQMAALRTASRLRKRLDPSLNLSNALVFFCVHVDGTIPRSLINSCSLTNPLLMKPLNSPGEALTVNTWASWRSWPRSSTL